MAHHEIERDWKTSAGFRAVVVMNTGGWRCGYVAVTPDCRLFGAMLPSSFFRVHGGVTYCGEVEWLDSDSLWLFGFDCAHAGDGFREASNTPIRSLEYCIGECESLARQIAKIESGSES